MRNIVLGISYDGTDFAGFQRQKRLPTIQGEIEDKLSALLGESVRIRGASRTDAGVHAKEQVINFFTASPIPTERFPRILNDRLPPSVRVIWAKEADSGFHARFSAVSRTYKYFVFNKNSVSPFIARFALICPDPTDLELMRRAGKSLEGIHDFAGFTSERGKTIRNLLNLDIRKKGNIIIFHLEANAFLKGMARNIVGLLLQIGKGNLPLSAVEETLKGDMDARSFTVAPQGLFLWKVKYNSLFLKEGGI